MNTTRYPSEPHIQWNHVDGPLFTSSRGFVHWLTFWERVKLKLGYLTLWQLDCRVNGK